MDFKFSSISLTLLIFLLIILTLQKLLKTSSSKLPPGPWKLPSIGNLHQLIGSSLVHHTLRDLATKHGPLMFLKLGQVPTLVVSSPESAKEIMKTHDIVFASRPATLYSKIVMYDTSDIIFSPYGEYWRQLRKIVVQELLSPARVESFRPIREEAMSNLVEWIASHEGSVINLTEKIFSATYGITSRAAFGKDSEDREAFKLAIEESAKLAVGFDVFELFPCMNFLLFLSPFKGRLERNHQNIDRILENIIDEHRKKKQKAEGCGGEDLVDILLKFQKKEEIGFSLSSDNIKAVILDVFAAGSETSATTTDWAMAEMLKNPRVMKKAQEEVRRVFRSKGSVDERAIREMTYLQCVVKETLRLHPAAPLLLPRESREKCIVNGYEIPAKTRVIVNGWAIGRDARYWSEPESFIPERFLNSTIDFKGNDFEFIPFGAGRRICPGLLYGSINIEFPLAMILHHFNWKLADEKKPKDLDMTESFGTTVRRRDYLLLVPSVVT